VLLDPEGGTFWARFVDFVRDDVLPRDLIDPGDLDLFLVTDDAQAACDELMMFVRNYRSIRWVGKTLVVRVQHGPTDDELATLNRDFGWLATDGRIERTDPLPVEVSDQDALDLDRIALRYGGFYAGGLRRLIDALNRLPSLQ